jgi:hypothetical protein
MPDAIEIEENGEAEIDVEFTSREEYIASAHQCLIAVDSYNAMTKIEQKLVKNIQTKCLEILNTLVNEMYDELFTSDEVK